MEKCFESIFLSSQESQEYEVQNESQNIENVNDEPNSLRNTSNHTENLCKALESERFNFEDPEIEVPIQRTAPSSTSSKRYKLRLKKIRVSFLSFFWKI